MQIEKHGAHAVLLTSENSKIYLNLSNTKPINIEKVEENALVLGLHEPEGKQYSITEPGEYEVLGVSVIALENKEEMDGVADFFELEVDGVVITWQADPAAEIDKEGWEMLTDTHLLLLDIDTVAEDTKLDKFISKHNPRRLVLVGDKSKAEKLVGIPTKDSNKKFKFSPKDFTEIEFTTESVHLA